MCTIDIYFNVVILVTEGFWDLVSDSIFTEVLVACNKFTTLYSKFVQLNLKNISTDILLVSLNVLLCVFLFIFVYIDICNEYYYNLCFRNLKYFMIQVIQHYDQYYIKYLNLKTKQNQYLNKILM